MAGIVGMVGSKVSSDTLRGMLGRVRHRGPDTEWVRECEGGGFAACGSDLAAEKGPAAVEEGDTIVLFDGEIYNSRSPGSSDAQVALNLYKKYGRLFPAYLQGAFACAVWDRNKLTLARDGVGIRPVYWGRDKSGNLYFASECKAFSGWVSQTQELSPATVFSTAAGVQGYTPVPPEVDVPETPEEAAGELRRLLFQATERRLRDGAVGGMLLSGGLDSSVIASMAQQIKPGLTAFTVGVEGASDVENAKVMAEYLGVPHKIKVYGPEEIKSLISDAVYGLESFDEDCVSGSIANMIASKWAYADTNCILSGEGGDELLGGYLMLKELPDEEARRRCMLKLIEVAYNTALQRLDRAMMYNSINYRTPFLDTEVAAFCLQLPVRWKIWPLEGKFVEKWLLREAFKDMLPERIYKREKFRFAGGSGTDDTISKMSRAIISEEEFTDEVRHTPGGYYLNSPKELYYYRIFKKHFPEPCFESLVGRWDPNK